MTAVRVGKTGIQACEPVCVLTAHTLLFIVEKTGKTPVPYS
jgi:hypothetical protein